MIYIASDHAGFHLKQKIIEKYPGVMDLGPDTDTAVDYPDYAKKLCEHISPNDQGILICGSGIGICIAANRYAHIRAALCMTEDMARLARQHDDANVVCLAARLLPEEKAFSILDIFFTTAFEEEERHVRRISKMS